MANQEQVQAISALADPVRRALYDYVSAQPEAVGREDAAQAVGVAVHKAKFHLERLVDEGLLDTEYRRLTGKTGPGAGRPAKLYARSRRSFAVSVPPRKYDLMGHILATALERSDDQGEMSATLDAAARQIGRRSVDEAAAEPPGVEGADEERGKDSAEGTGETAGEGGAEGHGEFAAVERQLARLGYEPEASADEIRLRNCPFDALVAEHTDLVCGVNHAYVQGVIDGVGARGACACAEKRPGYCCVTVRRSS